MMMYIIEKKVKVYDNYIVKNVHIWKCIVYPLFDEKLENYFFTE